MTAFPRYNIVMNIDYIKNSWKDYVKIGDKAYEIYKELEFGRDCDYEKWTIEDGRFCIYSHNYDCGGYDVNWIPLEWLELDVSEIRNRYNIERDKGNSSLIGYC